MFRVNRRLWTLNTAREAVSHAGARAFFLHSEGPRSRCYGRTTALRLFVQPYDEDEFEDEQFFTKFY
jgi:hypothetical protein